MKNPFKDWHKQPIRRYHGVLSNGRSARKVMTTMKVQFRLSRFHMEETETPLIGKYGKYQVWAFAQRPPDMPACRVGTIHYFAKYGSHAIMVVLGFPHSKYKPGECDFFSSLGLGALQNHEAMQPPCISTIPKDARACVEAWGVPIHPHLLRETFKRN